MAANAAEGETQPTLRGAGAAAVVAGAYDAGAATPRSRRRKFSTGAISPDLVARSRPPPSIETASSTAISPDLPRQRASGRSTICRCRRTRAARRGSTARRRASTAAEEAEEEAEEEEAPAPEEAAAAEEEEAAEGVVVEEAEVVVEVEAAAAARTRTAGGAR